MSRIDVGVLPDTALAAAALFHGEVVPRIRTADAGGEPLVLVFALPPAEPHTHAGWRLAAVQGLARELAPRRVNALVGDAPAAIAAACHWLDSAPGVTGQVFTLDGNGAGDVVCSPT